jgi:hypothetical protein
MGESPSGIERKQAVSFDTIISTLANHPTHRACEFIHEHTNRYEFAVKMHLEKIRIYDETGFSSETLSVIQMANDAKVLRYLADKLDEQIKRLTDVQS